MLDVVGYPRASPSMFCESIDTTPGGDKSAVEEFLAAASAFEPCLTDEHDEGQDDTVADKSTAHDEMSKTLAQMIISAESQCRDPAKQHLYPRHDRHEFPYYTVSVDSYFSDLAVEAFRDVEFEIDAKYDLDD